MSRVENLFNNVIDKDLQSMLLPLNLLQTIVFYPKYCISNNNITRNGRKSKILSLSATILFILIKCHDLFDKKSQNFIPMTIILSKSDFLLFSIGFIINFILCVLDTEKNIQFVLKFQDVHRYIHNDTLKVFTIANWVIFVSILVFYGTSSMLIFKLTVGSIHSSFSTVILLSFDANLVYAIRLIQLLKDKVDQWSVQALQYLDMDCRDRGDHCKRMFQAYVDILDCYDIYKDSFQLMVCRNVCSLCDKKYKMNLLKLIP